MSKFKIGDNASLVVSVDSEFVEAFAKFSGDMNPLHVDSEFAETTRFKRRVAHGMSYGALFSKIIGMDIPGPGALWMSQNFRFKQPVYLGDELTLRVEVTAISESVNILTLDCTATNHHGQQILSGAGEVMIAENVTPESGGTPAGPGAVTGTDEAITAQDATPESGNTPTGPGAVIVTGGTRGIGAAISKELASDGRSVIASYLQGDDEAEKFAAENKKITARKSDAGNPNDARMLVAWVKDNIGPVEVLVFNAGDRNVEGNAYESSADDYQRLLATQLLGPMALVQECISDMKKMKKGSIIAIGSSHALNSPPANMAPYVVAKSALTAWIKCLAVDSGVYGIRANVVAPGPTETSLLSGLDDRARKVLAARTPLRRLAQPEDIARVVKFLASDEAAYTTGAVLPVTGGALMP